MVTNPVMNLYVLTSESWFPLAMKSCSAFNTCEVEYHKWGVKTESDSFVSRILLFFKICMMGFWNVRLNIAWGIGIELGSTSGNATITSLFLSCLHNHNHNHKRTRKTWIYIRKFMVFGKLLWLLTWPPSVQLYSVLYNIFQASCIGCTYLPYLLVAYNSTHFCKRKIHTLWVTSKNGIYLWNKQWWDQEP